MPTPGRPPLIDSLALKLGLGLIALVVLIFTPPAYLVARAYWRDEIDAARSEARQRGELLRLALEDGMLRKDRRLVERLVAQYGKEPSVHRLVIYDRSGTLRYTAKPRQAPRRHERRDPQTCVTCHVSKGARGTTVAEIEGGEYLRVAVPLHNRKPCHRCHDPKERFNGVMIVDTALEPVRARMRSAVGKAVLAFGIFAVLLLGVAQIVVRRIVRTPEQVLRTAARMADPLIFTDGAGLVRYVNAAATRAVGYSAREIIGRPCSMIVPGFDALRASCAEDGVALERPIRRELRAVRRGGREFPAEVEVLAIPWRKQRSYTVTVRDLSDRKRAELAEERLRGLELEHMHLERLAVAGEMAAMVAHDVRTPLNALSLNLQLCGRLLRAGSAARALEPLNLAGAEISRIDQLVANYLAMAGPPRRTPAAPLDVKQVVAESVRFVERRAARQGTKVTLDAPAAGAWTRGDEARLRQVMLNLLTNALQAVGEGGEIAVHVDCEGDREQVLIAVTDDGPGIADEDLDRIFCRFFTTKEGGTGLGLAICARIVAEMGGTIRAMKRRAGGARFEVALPLIADARAEECSAA